MTNEEILDKLQKDTEYIGEKQLNLLNQWNDTESEFPVDRLPELIRFDRWIYLDFNFDNEEIIRNKLPDYVLDIYFEMKEFKKNSRNELLPDQELFAKLYSIPCNSQDEKSTVVYKFVFSRYFKNGKIKLDKKEEE